MATNSTGDQTGTNPPPPPPETTPTQQPTQPPPTTTTSTTSTSSTTSSNPPPTSSSTTNPPPTNTPPPSNTSQSEPNQPTPTPSPDDPKTSVTIVTQTRTTTPTNGAPTLSSSSTSTATSDLQNGGGGGSSSGGLSNGGKIAIAVVVPIAAIAILVILGIFLWRKRKQRKDLEDQRRKEVEEYGYNPNADPTIPTVALAGGDGTSSGYRGWGSTTLGGSTTGRKTSVSMSGGAAYSDAASPTRGTVSDTRSGEPLMAGDVPPSPEGEILGVMGPSASNNRGDVHRGPSNASSSYSAAARSDGSGDGPIGVAYGGPNAYYDQYGSGNPYSDSRPAEGGGQPIIRDVAARRNTRIESPAQYNQQAAGISQNF